MPGEFLQGVQVGANIANLRVMQQERMMQLRSQEALRAVQERHLAAQAEALMYNLQEEKQINTDIADANQIYSVLRNTMPEGDTPEEQTAAHERAQQAADNALLAKNPTAYKRLQDARLSQLRALAQIATRKAEEARAESYASRTGEGGQLGALVETKLPDGRTVTSVQTGPHQLHVVPDTMPQGGLTAQPIRDTNGNIVQYAVPGATGPRYFSPKAGTSESTKAEIKSTWKRIDALQERFDAMKDTSFSLSGKVPNKEKLELGKKIEDLKEKVRKLEKGTGVSSTQPTADKYEVDKVYVDDNGNKAIYKGNGRWEEQ